MLIFTLTEKNHRFLTIVLMLEVLVGSLVMSGIHKLGRRRRSTRHNDLSLGLRPENGSSENGPRSKPNSDVSLALVNNVIFNVYFDFFLRIG